MEKEMSTSKMILFIVLGILFWFTGAMLVSFIGERVLTDGNPYLPIAFVALIPVTAVFVVISKNIARLEYSELLKPTVIMTITATFLDATAFTWFRGIYHESFEIAMHGAALILWGAGLGLLMAYILETPGIPFFSRKH